MCLVVKELTGKLRVQKGKLLSAPHFRIIVISSTFRRKRPHLTATDRQRAATLAAPEVIQ